MSPAEHAAKYPEVWRKFSPRQSLIRYAWYVGIIFVAIWSIRHLDIPWEYFADAHVQAADLLTRMYPPAWGHFGDVLAPLIETIHIATLGTIVTFVISIPIAFLAARNTTYNATTWFIGRFILVASRSINTIVWALIFVAVFGPGPVAGIWAITFRSIGFMGKLIAEAIEEIDHGAVEAIEATGASRLHVLLIGVLPQVLPIIFGTTIYRWDINIRESTVLGFVGAGGIGIELYSSINLFNWQEVAVMLISVFGVVIISEFISATVRQRIT
ncbi:MAG: phosphonate ABC transporter, permease protein PhnE [Rhodospirillaceae bacterium]|jgi:phosphonate transport system permease protein|nr:phosphonate ABC transporter, permease protein PhnE [Rhodospirillaceae bacterium]MBT7486300.1 phosphonate ABC transporter, permease protein PhnE [Rhodospirillales bacterium]MBT4703561.1 phosphonate ABC transporter, permease protein PhnE [Rhodospirillaceae bacterium]MBT5036696.1 phosphonate ABC transporter, permease protein PhnE [Rhodospirillaceae bacterium]MBT6220216.1 phosphonate ABC transporter, permease protein PhnE [Rhodospirillaceae bacterium]